MPDMQTDCFPDSVAEWPKVPVSKLARVNPRYIAARGRDYPFVEMASVGEDFAGILKTDWRKLEESGLTRFKAGDTLFAKITPCLENGKVAFVTELPEVLGLGSTEFIVMSPCPETNPRFLFHLVCSHSVRGRAVAKMEGSTGRQRVPDGVFLDRLLVPMPPPTEQAAIARILDAVDTALERTRVATQQTELLKKSVIDQFFYEALGETMYADRPRRELPSGWSLVPTERLLAGEPKNGISPTTSSRPPGVPTFSIGAIRRGQIHLSDETYLKYAKFSATEPPSPFRVSKGDILIVRGQCKP